MSRGKVENMFQNDGNAIQKYGITFLGMSVAYFIIFSFFKSEIKGLLTFIVFVGMTTEGFVRMQSGGDEKDAMIVAAKYIGIGIGYHFLRIFLASKLGIHIPF